MLRFLLSPLEVTSVVDVGVVVVDVVICVVGRRMYVFVDVAKSSKKMARLRAGIEPGVRGVRTGGVTPKLRPALNLGILYNTRFPPRSLSRKEEKK